jgi:hypothetical protein
MYRYSSKFLFFQFTYYLHHRKYVNKLVHKIQHYHSSFSNGLDLLKTWGIFMLKETLLFPMDFPQIFPIFYARYQSSLVKIRPAKNNAKLKQDQN